MRRPLRAYRVTIPPDDVTYPTADPAPRALRAAVGVRPVVVATHPGYVPARGSGGFMSGLGAGGEGNGAAGAAPGADPGAAPCDGCD